MLTTKGFIEEYSKVYHVDVSDAKVWINTVFEFLFDAIPRYDKIVLPKIGNFKLSYLYSRRYFDMNTHTYKDSDPRMTVVFTPNATLVQRVRELPPNPQFARSARKNKNRLPSKEVEEDYIGSLDDIYRGVKSTEPSVPEEAEE